jgi:hypothetical protein
MSPSPQDSVAPGSAQQIRIHPSKASPRFVASPKPPHFNPLRFCLPGPSAEQRRLLIAKAAYFRAERRGFRPGHELEDWLAAEAEVDQQLADPR